MKALKQYENIIKIKQSYTYTLYKARIRHSSQAIFLKRYVPAAFSATDLAALKRRYHLLKTLDLPYVAKLYDLIEAAEPASPDFIIAYEDINGIPLKDYFQKGTEDLELFLKIAIELATVINGIHKTGAPYQGLRTSGCVYAAQADMIKLGDPEPLLTKRSPIMSLSRAEFKDSRVVRSILPYISPEQTGRMGWEIDFRTDLYSLGIVYYELLAGSPPFLSEDPFEIIHAHIARPPTPISDLQRDLPRPVADIIMRLLGKNPDARFQSVYGLRTDLENCLGQLTATGAIKPFSLAQKDVSETFRQPQRLYGREAEFSKLLDGLDRAGKGQSVFTLVTGYAGIGKSCLVYALQKPLSESGGYFIGGKYDQYHHDVPYSAFIKAFQEMVYLILLESEVEIASWKEKIEGAVEKNGRLIIDVIPEVEYIIGKQPEVIALPPAEAQNRFMIVFLNFVKAFTQKEHPLALFLDDLQWADAASLKLISLLSEFDIGYFYFLGACRNNEIAGNPLLSETLETIRDRKGLTETILLKPITDSDVRHLMADIFNQHLDAVSSLSDKVYAKTGGNPFFINQFLEVLHAEKIFSYDFDQGLWQWETEQINTKDITDNIVDLLSQRVRKLGQDIQAALQIAACIGDQFDSKTISIVSDKDLDDIAATLWGAQKAGFIINIEKAASERKASFFTAAEAHPDEIKNGPGDAFRFSHDRVRQAVYSDIPETGKQKIHLKIGRALLKATTAEKYEEHIFDIVKQLNLGNKYLKHSDEFYELAQANLTAGKKAKATAAYESAYNYFLLGINLLGQDSWHRKYDLTLALYEEGAEAAYLSGRFEEMERLARIVLTNAQTWLDQINVHEVQISALKAQNKLPEALQLGLSILQKLNFPLPKKPNKFHIIKALSITRMRLSGKAIEDFIHLPVILDPYKLAAIRIGAGIASAAYYSVPELLPIIIANALHLFLKHGTAPEFAFIYAGYGFILCSFLGDIDAGYRFGNLALNALDQIKTQKYRARTLFTVNAFIKHWKTHARETLAPLEEAYYVGLQTGDLEYAAISAQIYPEYLFFVGQELSGIEKELKKLEASMTQIKQETNLNHNRICRQTIMNLMHGNQDGSEFPPWHLAGEAYNEQQMVPIHLKANDRSILSMLYNFKTILCYMFHAYQQAVHFADQGLDYIDSAVGLMNVPLYYFYDSLARLAVFETVSPAEQKTIRRKVSANQKKMKRWAGHAPMNYLHKYYLVEAERARLDKKYTVATRYYDQAITLAQTQGYIHEEALAYELTAKYYLSQHLHKISVVFFNEACLRYSRWGGDAVVDNLKSEYAELLLRSTPSPIVEAKPLHLDSLTVIHSLQAISTEIVLESLLKNLMKILMETAGASRVLFLSLYDQQVGVEAELTAADDVVVLYNSKNIEDLAGFASMPILNFVQRTSKYKVIENVENETAFASDPYFLANRPKSILCLPVLKQSRLTAMLYFENHVAGGAFTQDRIEILQLLSSQIAISFENARLYDNLCRLEGELSRRLHSEKIIALISSSFINLTPPQIDNGIDNALKLIGEFSNEDRCFIFQISPDEKHVDETNVWCARQIESKVAYFQRLPLENFPWLREKLESNEIIQVAQLDDLPPEGHRLKTLLGQQAICSFFIVPMLSAGKLIGFLGCSAVRRAKKWDDDTIQLLRTVSEILAGACTRKRAEEDLNIYQHQLRKLSSELVLAEEKERRRIAVELHDHIGHVLANAMIKLGAVRKSVHAKEVTEKLEEIKYLLDECIKDTRSLTFDLSPHILYDMGLEAAVDWLVEKMQEEHGIEIAFEDDMQPKPLDDSHRILIYQAIRELLFNIVKHARAKRAEVHIERDEDKVRVVIEDDGVGMDLSGGISYGDKSGGFGLFSIQERLNSQNGRFEIASELGRGTRITIIFPIKPDEKKGKS